MHTVDHPGHPPLLLCLNVSNHTYGCVASVPEFFCSYDNVEPFLNNPPQAQTGHHRFPPAANRAVYCRLSCEETSDGVAFQLLKTGFGAPPPLR